MSHKSKPAKQLSPSEQLRRQGLDKSRRKKILAAIYDLANHEMTGEEPSMQTCRALVRQNGSTFIEDTALGIARAEASKKERYRVESRHAALGHTVFAVMTRESLEALERRRTQTQAPVEPDAVVTSLPIAVRPDDEPPQPSGTMVA